MFAGQKGRPGNSNIVEQSLRYIQSGFQNPDSPRGESPCDTPDGTLTPEFSRSGSLRGSKKGRLQAIDENKTEAASEERKTRKSTDLMDNNDLMDFLIGHAEDSENRPGCFERQGSQRSSRRRRTKANIAIDIERERAPSPASVNSGSGPNSPTDRVLSGRWRGLERQDSHGSLERRGSGRATSPTQRNAPSPLVTSELRNRMSNCSVETTDSAASSRWSNGSSEVSIGDTAEDDGRSMSGAAHADAPTSTPPPANHAASHAITHPRYYPPWLMERRELTDRCRLKHGGVSIASVAIKPAGSRAYLIRKKSVGQSMTRTITGHRA